MRGVAVPVLESALDRSLQLATSMDARGYGRRHRGRQGVASVGQRSHRRRAVAGGGRDLRRHRFGLALRTGPPRPGGRGRPVRCRPGRRRAPHGAARATDPTRGDSRNGSWRVRDSWRWWPWRSPDALDVPGLTVSFSPLAFPSIPLLPVVGILIALVPAIAAPNPIASSRDTRGRQSRGDRGGCDRDGGRRPPGRRRTSRGCRHDHVRPGVVHLYRSRPADAAPGQPRYPRGRALGRRGGDGDGQVDPAAGHQRSGAALQRRDAGRDGHGGREDDQGQPTARSGRRRRLRGPEPAGQLRDRDRRGRAGVHHGEPRGALRRDAPPGGGRGRSAGPAGAARPITARRCRAANNSVWPSAPS